MLSGSCLWSRPLANTVSESGRLRPALTPWRFRPCGTRHIHACREAALAFSVQNLCCRFIEHSWIICDQEECAGHKMRGHMMRGAHVPRFAIGKLRRSVTSSLERIWRLLCGICRDVQIKLAPPHLIQGNKSCKHLCKSCQQLWMCRSGYPGRSAQLCSGLSSPALSSPACAGVLKAWHCDSLQCAMSEVGRCIVGRASVQSIPCG
jgi:hypothetical protein